MSNDTKEQADLSMVILCYKEGEMAREFVNLVEGHLDARKLNYELVLVGNYWAHEKDAPAVLENTRILNELATANKRIVVVSKPKEGGFGWDMRSGFLACTGKNLGVIDGDGQIPATDILRVWDIFSLGGYDCVKTFRIRRGDGSWRGSISFGYNFLLKILFPRVYTGDVNGKPKILSRAAYDRLHLTANDWFIDAELLIQGSYLGFRFAEVSSEFDEMTHRKSYIKPMAIVESVKNMIVYRMTRMGEYK